VGSSIEKKSYLFTYLPLKYDTRILPEYFLSRPNAYLLRI